MPNFKKILIGTQARDAALKGANFLAEAVKSTLGPWGLNALLEKGNRITNDGVTISGEISSGIKDELERRGAVILHEAATKTNDIAGDGTTTAIVLAQTILKEAIKFLGDDRTIGSKKSAIEIIQTIEKEKKEIIEKLMAMAKPIETKEELINSATVSVEDPELGKLIGEAQWTLGKEGELMAEETAERESSVEFVNGIRIDNGFGASYVINNQEKNRLELKDVHVILTNNTFPEYSYDDQGKPKGGGIAVLAPLLNQLLRMGYRHVVIVGRAFSFDAIKDCKANVENNFFLYPINAPYVGQDEVMKDLETVLGGKYINAVEGNMENIQLSDVGFAEKIIAERYSARIAGKKDDQALKRIAARIEELEKNLKGEVSNFVKREIRRRIAQLKSGFGIVKIGMISDTERKYKKDKAEDACNATRLAWQEGVVDGGGLAFKQISEELPDTYILKRPLMSIYEQIISTAPEGFKIENHIKDPVFVLRTALENACGVAGIFASVNTVIASENVKTHIKEELLE